MVDSSFSLFARARSRGLHTYVLQSSFMQEKKPQEEEHKGEDFKGGEFHRTGLDKAQLRGAELK